MGITRYKHYISLFREMSHSQKKGAEGGTPTERRASKQDTEFIKYLKIER